MNSTNKNVYRKSTTGHVACLLAVLILSACGGGADFLEQDTDGDGLVNSSDWCPTVAEEPNDFEDEDGCPDVVPEPSPAPLDAHFDGQWAGIITILPDGRPPFVGGSATSNVSGGTLMIDPRLFDASVMLPCGASGSTRRTVATGDGSAMGITSSAPCSPSGPTACPWAIAYEQALIRLVNTSRLEMSGTGTYSDCTGTVPTSVSFVASLHL